MLAGRRGGTETHGLLFIVLNVLRALCLDHESAPQKIIPQSFYSFSYFNELIFIRVQIFDVSILSIFNLKIYTKLPFHKLKR